MYLVELPFNKVKISWDFLVLKVSAYNIFILMNDFPCMFVE